VLPSSTPPTPPTSSEGEPQEAHLWEYIYVVLRRRRLVLAVFFGVAALATLRSLLTRPVYEATAQILIERDTPSVLSFKEVAQVDAARDDYYQTQYKLLQSRALVRRVIESLNLLQDAEFGGPRSAEEIEAVKAAAPGASQLMEGAIDAFLRRLKVLPVRNSRLVMVTYESFRPDLAAATANRLSQLYIQQTLEFRYQTSSEAAQWLGQQIAEQTGKVEGAERALQTVKEQEGIVNIEERRTLLEQKLKELGTALTSLRTDRLEKEALYNQMRHASNPEELPDVMRSPLVQSLRIELATLERAQAQLLERYMDQHPEVVKVRNQIQETRKKIAAESQRVIRAAENDYKAAAAQEASVSSALEAAKAEALDLSRRSVQYDTAKREADAGKEVLNSLLSRHKQTDVAQELKNSNIRIVDAASVPRGPVRPQKTRDIALGLALGLFLGVGLAFFLDYLDNTIKTPEDVRKQLGAPLLAVIPEIDAPTDVVINSGAETPLADGYRLLRTSLTYSWPESSSRILLVTSTSPGEGKTVTSVNLALILASMGGKVLLIDCDMRRPQSHTYLRGKKSPGLSDLLVGRARPSDAIQRPPGTTVSLLSAGTRAPSPADLMTLQTMRDFLDGLRGFYDWIVLDTPPVGPVAEALILGPLADGVVVVVGAEMVPRNGVRHTLDRVRETGARLLGVVLNRAQVEKHSYYYGRYYGHYYGHYYGSPSARPAAARGKVANIREKRGAR
jgi:succinoglycan biosynthesis transport protein ExoP